MLLLLIFLIFCIGCGSGKSHTDILCPISRNPVYGRQGNFHYPLEIYFPGIRYESNISCVKELLLNEIVTCPLKSMGCPLIKENIVDALGIAKSWPKLTSFCALKKALMNPNVNIKVIVLGGSVAVGVDANGCCREPKCMVRQCRRCAWSHHLGLWLRVTTNANVTVFNKAVGGTNSIFTGEVIDTILSEIGTSALTSHDVVFLDFSVNDMVEGIPIKDIKLKQGLEKLIRFLISKAVDANDVPNIVLLETAVGRYGPPSNAYNHVYRAIAKHYGLHLFSYVDAVQSEISMAKQAAYHDHLSFRGTFERHPPWHGHLLYADFIAGTLLYQMNRCDQSASVSSSVTDRAGPKRRSIVKPRKKSVISSPPSVVLPTMLVPNDNISYVCVSNIPPMVRMSYKEIVSNTSFGSYFISPSNTWQVALDRKNRGGFIMKITPGSTYSNVHDAKLVFPLGITVGQLRNMSVLLQVQYMRSYVDAGMVSVGVCEFYFKNLDALWTDYQKYRYTLQDVFSARAMLEWCMSANKKDEDMVELTILFKVSCEGDEWHNMTRLALKEPRKGQLFKLVSILVCQVA